jgi:hypothetical protein
MKTPTKLLIAILLAGYSATVNAAAFIYWIDTVSASIRRANVDGTDAENIVSGLHDPRSIAIDGLNSKLYWTELKDGLGEIRRANLDGSNIETLITPADVGQVYFSPAAMDLDLINGKLYCGEFEAGRIYRANLDGSGIESLGPPGIVDAPTDLELDQADGKMYWTDEINDEVARANLDGTDWERLASPQPNNILSGGLALDQIDEKLYWKEEAEEASPIMRSDLDGSMAELAFTAPPEVWGRSDIDIFNGRLYGGGRAIWVADLDGSHLQILVPNANAHGEGGIALYATADALVAVIDIKPGNRKNPVNPRSKGTLKVAVLTNENLDADAVDVDTVQFGPAGAQPVKYRLDDVDGDGDWDLVLKFKTQDTGITCGDTEATLTAQTFDGTAITGTDSVKTVGCKPKKDHKRDHKKGHKKHDKHDKHDKKDDKNR